MKNVSKKIIFMMLFALLVFSLSACGKENEVNDTSSNTANITVTPVVATNTSDVTENTVTYRITFMNGDATLGTVDVDENTVLVNDQYVSYETVPDTEFMGWFETPTFLASSEKDLTNATFSKDTTLYGNFKSTKAAQDTREWYLAGASEKGILKVSNWADAEATEEDKACLQLMPTEGVINEFSITLDLFNGDQFQLISDWSWDGQKGYGCFTTLDDTQMESGGGLGGSADTSNVNVIMDGNYTVTLTTDPDSPIQDTITVIRNGDPLTTPEVAEEAPYVVSESTGISIKGGWVADWSDVKELARADGTNSFSISMDLEADTELCFMVLDNGEDTGIVLKEENVKDTDSIALLSATGNNIKVAEQGNYLFTVDTDAMSVIITKN